MSIRRNSTGEVIGVSDTVSDRKCRRYYVANLGTKKITAVSMDEKKLYLTREPEFFGCHSTKEVGHPPKEKRNV